MLSEPAPLLVVLAQPRGFCAGVNRAIEIVERALSHYGAPVYVRHQIVHNHHVVEGLRARGAVFVDEIDEIPDGGVTVFSAHGVSRRVEGEAALRDLDVIDATCPLVRKVHKEGARYAGLGYDVVLIGHRGHAEIDGTIGRIDGRLHLIASPAEVADIEVADPERVAYITQTTLSVIDTRDVIAALRARFPAAVGPDTRDICYATQNRQKALLDLIEDVDLLLVVGASNSSNSNRLRELGARHGVPSHLIDGPAMLDPDWLEGVGAVGLTAGASAPEALVQDVVARLGDWRRVTVEERDGVEEAVQFPLPERLRSLDQSAA
ncbi:4-hydroxy-3-methylbut-2-enyl diphosphate reductase [Amorphus orientalis]|uniref:4-hydroxy-3-methylbut-2-enyl diphosphate reductase n=1 Tax=Amorphus orientalis TaxID=649198 RepID=A0AAE4AU14_9HYPH|nr:4-hydroxy-3-methylbut-2-enyl diphosphate reductase [Amorphus orientalis]MDQ0315494.1 4-hydroxy-3-methylbut-2-enyl diphosphate reductase [Amorphus orientalis]